MIGWLEGKRIDTWSNNSRKGLIVSCFGIGYEVQLLPRNLNNIATTEKINLWIHQVFREDGIYMFGFIERSERDLFRKLIETNGIGPQIAISLLDKYEYTELINAINNENITMLTKVSGIGRRIAERLTVELRGKLTEPVDKTNYVLDKKYGSKSEVSEIIEDEVIKVLTKLDYEDDEIKQALQAAKEEIHSESQSSNTASINKNDDLIDTYIKHALVWLSQEVSSKGA